VFIKDKDFRFAACKDTAFQEIKNGTITFIDVQKILRLLPPRPRRKKKSLSNITFSCQS
jgi:hypothetical protein